MCVNSISPLANSSLLCRSLQYMIAETTPIDAPGVQKNVNFNLSHIVRTFFNDFFYDSVHKQHFCRSMGILTMVCIKMFALIFCHAQFTAQKLTEILKAVGIKTTALSASWCADLEALCKEQEKQREESAKRKAQQPPPPNESASPKQTHIDVNKSDGVTIKSK